MHTIEINPENLQMAKALVPSGSPVMMLNLLRYKKKAAYSTDKHFGEITGREAYFERYVPAFNKVSAGVGIIGIKPFWVGNVLLNMVSPANEKWDDIAMVEYPDFAAFCNVVESDSYRAEAAYHRLAALEDWRLIAMMKMDLG